MSTMAEATSRGHTANEVGSRYIFRVMTPDELKCEFDYRREERLALLGVIKRDPTPQEKRLAEEEGEAWIKRYYAQRDKAVDGDLNVRLKDLSQTDANEGK